MDIQTIISIFEYVGALLIAYAALRVHHRVLHEHRIDTEVTNSMKGEQKLGILGVILITIAFILSLIF
jgi:hypothetical protein